MDLCFISSSEQRPAITGPCIWVCPDYNTRERLKREGKDAVLYDEYLTAEAGKKGDELAFDLSVQWHYHEGKDFTLYKGASLGRAHEWKLWYEVLIPRIKYLICVHELLRREKPKSIRFDNALGPWRLAALEEASGKLGPKIKIETYGQAGGQADDVFKNTPTQGYRHSRHAAIKRLMGSALGHMTHALGRIGGRRPRVLTSGYFAFMNFYLQWAGRKPFDLVFFAPTAVLMQKKLAMAIPSLFSVRTAPKNAQDETRKREMAARWENVRSQDAYRKKFIFLGADLFALFAPELDGFFRNTLARYAQEFDNDAYSLQVEKIDAVLLPFTVPPQLSLLLQAAKSNKIPVALLRHGITYLNDFNTRDDVDVDIIFCWGGMQKEHYGAMQKKAGFKLVETGNPKFDSIFDMKRHGEAGPAEKKERPFILYLTTGKDNSAVSFREGSAERALLAFLDQMREQQVDITVKLHPAASKEYFQKLVEMGGKYAKMNIQIVKGEDPMPFIRAADVVMGTYSTTLLESALSGKPTLFYNYNPLNEDRAYAKLAQYGLNEFTPATAKKMKEKILEILVAIGAGQTPAPFKPGGQEYLCGPFDGKSSERVLTELGRLIKTDTV